MSRSTPPSASEGLEQCGCFRKACRLCLRTRKQGLAIRLLRGQHRQVAHRSELLSGQRKIETHLRGLLGGNRRLECLGVSLERVKGVGHVLESAEDGAAILRCRLLEGRLGGPLSMP